MTRAADIDEQAARWLIRLDAQGTESEGTVQAEFESWANSDLRHRAAFLRLSTAWTKAGRLRTLVPTGAPIDPDFLGRRPRRAQWYRPMWMAGLAASIAAIALLGWWQFRPVTMTYRTELGGFSRVPLADGSTVALNTDSEIRVRLSGSVREVTLVRGEAIFDVAHDRRRPFDVYVESAIVRAVGTSFDVRRLDGQDVDVIVTEGRVAVDAPGAMRQPGSPVRAPVMVEAGEAARAHAGHMEVRKIESADAARRLAWQAGLISFQGETLAEAIADFNRYGHRQLALADPGLGTLRVGGSFKTTDIDSFAAALRTSFGLRADDEGRGILVIRRDRGLERSEPAPVIE
jgi:transmembrane sensor